MMRKRRWGPRVAGSVVVVDAFKQGPSEEHYELVSGSGFAAAERSLQRVERPGEAGQAASGQHAQDSLKQPEGAHRREIHPVRDGREGRPFVGGGSSFSRSPTR